VLFVRRLAGRRVAKKRPKLQADLCASKTQMRTNWLNVDREAYWVALAARTHNRQPQPP
jgi:hypothetical protein